MCFTTPLDNFPSSPTSPGATPRQLLSVPPAPQAAPQSKQRQKVGRGARPVLTSSPSTSKISRTNWEVAGPLRLIGPCPSASGDPDKYGDFRGTELPPTPTPPQPELCLAATRSSPKRSEYEGASPLGHLRLSGETGGVWRRHNLQKVAGAEGPGESGTVLSALAAGSGLVGR
jgi:hypothetical protein